MVTRKSSGSGNGLASQPARDFREDAVAPLLNRAADRTVTYVREDPVKSLLLAASLGAALLALFTLLARSRKE